MTGLHHPSTLPFDPGRVLISSAFADMSSLIDLPFTLERHFT